MNQELFHNWLSGYFGCSDFVFAPLAGDASFRRYFRVSHADKSFVAMDASAEKEKCFQFVAIANALRTSGLYTPEIFAQDLQAGYLLLTDFGDDLYLRKLNLLNAEALYDNALNALVVLADCKKVQGYHVLPFTAHFMRDELNWFHEWFLEKHLNLILNAQTKNMLAQSYDLLAESCAAQPRVFMHRDYHSANLLVLPDNSVGILDFQDAFIGPVTYDLVSLLRDCYIEWPDELVTRLALSYREKILFNVSEAEFLKWFDWMGMQRHLKALLTFSRKYRRDNNSNYLQHIPRTLNYILRVSARYSEFKLLHEFFQSQVLEQLACMQ